MLHIKSDLFNKTDKFSIFGEYLEKFHDERQVVVSPADVFNLKITQRSASEVTTEWRYINSIIIIFLPR